ncbi:RtcB-like RNA ligase [Mycobacterium phage Edugator]|uniref:3'-phosphate/5'-hydroxy nucleic acid ligase n=4 Tax=Kratiovirus larva TaxID=1056831 RepID=A0A221J7A7_9CAUD|nr:tRNA splicing ligase [Mycobacterium phage Larva]ASM62584.1 RtcB-like RNA ligase [Mycobacterium phage AlleyCat]ASR85771.1 RtcB-like RNA ligase [Mycobacterium phage Edugator]QQV92678.1 RtcB-like RNA ligase [Mycobacterium phage Psycho]WAB09759.1 RtcB-like RNA ligase [Mycobacterium phage Dadosky]AEL19725.1 RtcB-like RNA ligase [Mycobacterium phage Larva]
MTAKAINPKLVNFASEVDDETINQAMQITELPFVHPHVALMPDAHVGKGSSVGTVIPTRGAVIPAAVGVDIGCGMIATLTAFTQDDIAGRDLAALRESIESAIPMSAGGYNKSLDRYPFTAGRIEHLEDEAERRNVDLSHSPKWREQLGTLGGGNHFIELCVDHRGCVWLFLHSGSRGVGNKIAQKHIKIAQAECDLYGIELPGGNKDLAYLVEGEPSFDAYLNELRWAQQFALFNRDEMMDRYRQAFARWMGIGVDEAPVVEIAGERVNAHHNYTVQECVDGELVWVTRKGAISAKLGERGLIPGSMGTASYVVTGKGNPQGLQSAPHGAGRRFSRTKARKLFTVDDLADRMRGIEYRHGEAWVDEIPDAYKPIDVVMHDAGELVSVDAELRQIVNVKGQ